MAKNKRKYLSADELESRLAEFGQLRLLENLEVYLPKCSRSGHTVRAYRNHLRHFVDFVALRLAVEDLPDLRLERISSKLVHDFIEHRESCGDSPTTLNARLGAIKSFFNWLTEAYELPTNPISEASFRRESAYDNTFCLTDEQIRKIRLGVKNGAVGSERTFHCLRDWLIFEVMLHTGMKGQEISQIKCSQVEELLRFFDEVLSSGWRYHKIPIVKNIRGLMNVYSELREERLLAAYPDFETFSVSRKGALPFFVSFYNVHSLERDDLSISAKTIYRLIRELGASAGLTKLQPSAVRHTYGFEVTKHSGDLDTTKKRLRLHEKNNKGALRYKRRLREVK